MKRIGFIQVHPDGAPLLRHHTHSVGFVLPDLDDLMVELTLADDGNWTLAIRGIDQQDSRIITQGDLA